MPYIVSEMAELVGTITLDHERRRNALSRAMVEEVIVHRGVQKIYHFWRLASPEPRKRAVGGRGRMNLLSAPVH